MKINVYSIESRFNKLIEDIEDLTFNYVYCLDEIEDENTISYLDKCHLRLHEINAFHDSGVICYSMYCALYDYVNALILRHLGSDEYNSKIAGRYAPFEI